MSTDLNRNSKRRIVRDPWPAAAWELAKAARGLSGKEKGNVVAQIAAITGRPKRACLRLVMQMTREGRRRAYVWPLEIEILLKEKRSAGVERNALLAEIAATTGYPRRVCVEFLNRRLGRTKASQVRGVWPEEARALVAAQRGTSPECAWALVPEVMRLTGRSQTSCWQFIKAVLDRPTRAVRRWSPELWMLARENSKTEGPEFEALLAEVRTQSGYEESVCRKFLLRSAKKKRSVHKWPREARELARKNRVVNLQEYRALVARLVAITGFAKPICRRFLRRMGVRNGYRSRPWKREEIRKLAKDLGTLSVAEIAKQLRRSERAVRQQMWMLGLSTNRNQTWYTVVTLARSLRVSTQRVQRWIELGMLQQTALGSGEFKRWIITSDDVDRFCTEHMNEIVRGKVDPEQVNILRQIANPGRNVTVRETKREKEQKRSGKKGMPE